MTHARPGRIAGVDAARAVALVGMFAVHVLPLEADGGGATVTGAVAAGRASALFAVLAGVGIALGTGGTRPPPDARSHGAAAAGLLVRGALVGLLGLLLVGLDPPVAVILAYYGLLFAVAAPLLRLRAGALAAGALLSCALAPVASHLLRADLPRGAGEQPGLTALAEPAQLLRTLALTGYYPVLTWTAYLLAGLAAGRLDLRRTRTAVGLLAGGAALAAAAAAASALLLAAGGAAALGSAAQRRRYGTVPPDSWWWLAVDIAHSGTPFDLAHTTGTALAVLGACLLLARVLPVALAPAAAVGAVPLTLYTAHVVAVTAFAETALEPAAVLTWNLLGALVAGVAVAAVGRRGPLEWAASAAGRAARRAVVDSRGPVAPAERVQARAARLSRRRPPG